MNTGKSPGTWQLLTRVTPLGGLDTGSCTHSASSPGRHVRSYGRAHRLGVSTGSPLSSHSSSSSKLPPPPWGAMPEGDLHSATATYWVHSAVLPLLW